MDAAAQRIDPADRLDTKYNCGSGGTAHNRNAAAELAASRAASPCVGRWFCSACACASSPGWRRFYASDKDAQCGSTDRSRRRNEDLDPDVRPAQTLLAA